MSMMIRFFAGGPLEDEPRERTKLFCDCELFFSLRFALALRSWVGQ